ncbi:type II secretion system minor pseudopilin GspJ [Thiohalomonas denitrificans]|uniref:Type II secretion system protein J n=1 Tax=Thiohalomonas denitrificans TaxID=415747 RepID=A0A1G5QSQ2_9GAMM|nr:type II secretion system minor pseudopilin GspJ [Thiohalomonas denitrificans]SCZ64885.1 general secretion pathway protein J [Thiohalomonas denitrificans]
MRRQRGFTLLELLVALGIFGLVAAMAFSGLRTVLDAREQTARHAERLAELERTMLFLGRDVIQTVDRPIRDELGDTRPALSGGEGHPALELTRSGWANPTGAQRSTLQRVGWEFREERLYRSAWRVLDRAHDSEPYSVPMLRGVRELTIRFLDADREWSDSWPPPEENTPTLPLAISVSLELEDWGAVERLWMVPGGGV